MHYHVHNELIEAFVERWQPETNSFHMPWGEMSITLHNVFLILGIRIDEDAVLPSHVDRRLDARTLSVVQCERFLEFFDLRQMLCIRVGSRMIHWSLIARMKSKIPTLKRLDFLCIFSSRHSFWTSLRTGSPLAMWILYGTMMPCRGCRGVGHTGTSI